ncbi:MAG: MFS transporter [Caulobacteraceae bacterium]
METAGPSGDLSLERQPSAAAADGLPIRLDSAQRTRLLGYAGGLMLLAAFAAPSGNLIGIPVIFFLKNKLHLNAPSLAIFNALVSLPLYFGFVFGLLRDRWSPFGLGDRGHFILFGLSAMAAYAIIAQIPPTYALLLIGLIVVTCFSQVVFGAANGIFSSMGQRHLMPGQASTVLNVVGFATVVAASLLGGVFSNALEGRGVEMAAKELFLVGSGLMAALALLAVLGPRSLYTAHASRPTSRIFEDLVRLPRHKAIWAPFLLLLLWNFAPGLATALQYHLADQLHATDAQVGAFYAIFWGCELLTALLYGWVCQRVRLSRLLFWGTVVAIPQMIPLLFAHSAQGALMAAVPVGLMGGFVSAAYLDLAIRSCPAGLQGTMMMLVTSSAYFIALRAGDVWGANIYQNRGGFTAVLWVTTAVYALQLPVLLLAPRALTATRDGETLAAP